MAKIVFDCGNGGHRWPWGGWCLTDGTALGGSETAVCMLAETFAKREHHVVILNNCTSMKNSGLIYENVHYIRYDTDCIPIINIDVLIGQRDINLLRERKAPIQIMYCHDVDHYPHTVRQEDIDNGIFDTIDSFAMLTPSQAARHTLIPDDKKFICPIGIDHKPFEVAESKNIERKPNRAIYFSQPGRGLHKLRELWLEVRKQIPNAELASYWWNPDEFLPSDLANGILPMERCDSYLLAEKISEANLLAMYSTFADECCPATMLLAQRGGAVPIAIAHGGIRDTLHFGHGTDHNMFVTALCNAFRDTSYTDNVRAEMVPWMKDNYKWEQVAEKWERHYNF